MLHPKQFIVAKRCSYFA